jgi:PAS domain S-box-containing protein
MAELSTRLGRLAAFDVVDRAPKGLPPVLIEMAFGLLCLGAAVVARFGMDWVAPTVGPYSLLYPAILISTLFGHWRSGLVTYIVGFGWAWVIVLPSTLVHQISQGTDGSRLLVNAASALVILIFAEIFRRAVRLSAAEREAALMELGDREARMRLALDAGRLGAWTLDVGAQALKTSDVCRTIFGRNPAEPFEYADLLAAVHEDDRERMLAAVERAVATRSLYDIEYRIVTPAGEVRWVQIRAETALNPGGVSLTGISVDVTDRRRADTRRDALALLSEAFQSIANPADAAFAASQIVGEALGLNRVGYGVISADKAAIDVDRDWTASGADQLSGTLPLSLFMSRREDLLRGETIAISDVREDPRTLAEAPDLESRQARAIVNSGVLEHGRLVAVFYLNSAAPRVWTADELALVRDIAERTRMTAERLRSAAALREANETLESKVEERTQALMQAEDALRQAQKMEAVGQLTGGIAHDFNNLLAGISGSLEMIDTRLQQGRSGELARYVTAAQAAAARAASLTQRLLAFSRRQTLDPRPTDVNRLIAGIDDLLRRSVGPNVESDVVGAGGLWTTRVDASQLENALLNLCINARDAMAPNGGRLTIETANTWLDKHAAEERDLPPGQYVSICVTDTGTGMNDEVIARAFDPFYTTKPIGQGTGLGLSMVYGFVRQSGGQVRIYSELGKGTTMCLYLPRFMGPDEVYEAEKTEPAQPGCGETVLIIDDEPTVRMLVSEVLSELGYTPLEADDGPSGLGVLQSDARIDLLITDVGLPGGMNGRQIADAARLSRPDLKVLFITGYAENAAVGNGQLEAGMAVITKPFVMTSLAAKVREMISQ